MIRNVLSLSDKIASSFYRRIVKIPSNSTKPCWEYRSKSGKAYSYHTIMFVAYRTNRLAYADERVNPNGVDIRKRSLKILCGNKNCCQPAHMEVGEERVIEDMFQAKPNKNMLICRRHIANDPRDAWEVAHDWNMSEEEVRFLREKLRGTNRSWNPDWEKDMPRVVSSKPVYVPPLSYIRNDNYQGLEGKDRLRAQWRASKQKARRQGRYGR